MDFFILFKLWPDDEGGRPVFQGSFPTKAAAEASAREHARVYLGTYLDQFSESTRIERPLGIPAGYWANELLNRDNGEGDPTGSTYWICPQTVDLTA